MARSAPAVRQIRPRAAMLTVPVRDTTMWSSSHTSTSIQEQRQILRISPGSRSLVPDRACREGTRG